MKVKFSQFIFALLICFIFIGFIFAQTKLIPLKFDEFIDVSSDYFYPSYEMNLSQRIERLVKQVRKNRRVKIYIIYYRARQLNDGDIRKIENWAEDTKNNVIDKANLDYETVLTIDGGYRENNTLEYWIAPKNAELPKPSPTFDKSESIVCKEVGVYSDTEKFDKDKTISFSARTSYPPKTGEVFQWEISAGEIITGQGTNNITVDLRNVSDKHITASAETNDLPYSCPKIGYTVADLAKKPLQIDSAVRYNYSDLSARMEALRIGLGNNPIAKGYIIVYAARNGGTRDMERAIKSVQRIFAFLALDPNRYTIVRGGYRDYNTVDTWLLQPSDAMPQPTPTVDNKFINVPKQTKKAVRRK
jgi:hypothetical protein